MLYLLALTVSIVNAFVWVAWSRAVHAGRAIEAGLWDAAIVLLSLGATVSIWHAADNDALVFLVSALGGGVGTWGSLVLVRPRTVPYRQQADDYNCGPAALQSLLAFHNVIVPQDRLERMSDCTQAGTTPEGLVKAAVLHGFDVSARCGWTLPELAAKVPVLCCIQAQGTPEEYAKDESGHYVVVTSVENGWVVYMDPSEGEDRLPADEFVARWHDKEDYGPIVRWGMTVRR